MGNGTENQRSNTARRGMPAAGALLFAAALVCGGSQAVVRAAAAPPAASPAGVISAIADGRFQQQAMRTGDIYTIAGGGTGGRGDGGLATLGVLLQPGAVLVDAAGDMLICDTGDDRIREVAGPAAGRG
jgi:hypothetical protein